MQQEIWQTIGAWALTVLVYPGLLFAVLVVLAGELMVGAVQPLFSPRPYRRRARLSAPMQPLYLFFKLLGRRNAVRWQRPGDEPAAPSHPGEPVLAAIGAIAPLLALVLLPAGAGLYGGVPGLPGEILVVLFLLAVQPVSSAVSQLREGGLEALSGARHLGRLLAGLLPTLLLVAALVQVSGANTLLLANLTAAPLTAQQTLVRLLAGVTLLLVLPWWSGRQPEQARMESSAGAYAGRLLQGVALAAFWAAIVLPAPGDLPWSVLVFVLGTIFAYVTTKIVAARWLPTRREGEAANLLWATTLPAAALALVLALWTNA